MDEEGKPAPREITAPLDFKDKDGWTYHLSPRTYKHIKKDHQIDDPCSFIEDTLLDPCAIIEDKTKADRWIYHKDYEKNLYKVVVTCIVDRRIKTAFVSDELKGGVVKWLKKGPLTR